MIEANIEQHAEDAAFLWLLRDQAVASPLYDRAELAGLDGRVEAHLDGLRVAGEPAWDICKRTLAMTDAGEAFALANLAIATKRWRELAVVLDACDGDLVMQRGIISALGWARWADVEQALTAMLDQQSPPALRRIGTAGALVHRRDVTGMLDVGITSPDLPLRRRAWRGCGELGDKRWLSELKAAAGSSDPEERFWVAWSLVLLGEVSYASFLWEAANTDDPWAPRALDLAARASHVQTSATQIDALRANPSTTIAAIDAACATGDPRHIPWLVELLETPELARRATLALCTITGIDLQAEQAEGDAPPRDEDDDDNLELDPEADLLWPEPRVLAGLCRQKLAQLTAGQRYLLGQPIAAPWLETVLARGSQFHRRAAALELCIARPGHPLPETRGPAFRT